MIMKQNHKFKETEIGMIPEDWEVKPAESFCGRVTDGTHATPEKRDEGNYLITSRHLKEGHLDFDNAYFISTSDFNEINKRSKVDQWDIIFSMIGTVGEVYLEKSNKIEYAIKNVGLFKSGNELYGKWLFFFLKSRLANEYIRKNRSGTTQEYITLGSLRKFPIAYPRNTTEMQEIVLHLDSLQNKIELNQQMNATLEKIGQALFKHWFIDFEFPDEKGRPYKSSGGEMVDSELGEIPKGWGVASLGEFIELAYGKGLPEKQRKNGTYPVVGSNGIVGHHNQYYVEGPGIVIGRKGTIGEVIWIDNNFFPIDTTFYIVPKAKEIKLYYFYYLLQTQDFEKIGSDSAVPGLNRNFAYMNLIVKPPIHLVECFNDICQELFMAKNINSSQIATLCDIRDSLLPRLMSGRIRVGQ